MKKTLQQVTLIIGAYGIVPNCVGVVEKRIEPEEGGTYSKLAGCSYLFKGFPNVRVVESLRTAKKTFTVLFPVARTIFAKIVVAMMVVFPRRVVRKFLFALADAYIELAYSPIEKDILSPIKYCKAVREIHRVSEIIIKKLFKDERARKVAGKIRDTLTMALEYDAAYKFPFQDIVPEINKEAFRRSPAKEMKRICEIFRRRDITGEMMSGVESFLKAMISALRFSRKARRIAIAFIDELDLEKVGLDEADWYFCLLRGNHTYRDIHKDVRAKEKEETDKRLNHKIPKVIFQQVSTPQGV